MPLKNELIPGLTSEGNIFLALLQAREQLGMTDDRVYTQEEAEHCKLVAKKLNKKIIIRDEARSIR